MTCKVAVLFPMLALAFPAIPTREIAPGVFQPYASIGTGTSDKTGDDRNATIIVANWLANGGRGIDTAWSYFNQEGVASAIAASGVAREELFITSKILMCMPDRQVHWMVEQNLRKLNTDYFDLMLIHMPSTWELIHMAGPMKWCDSTWKLLEEYHAKGVFKAIGISNFVRRDIEKLVKSAKVMPAVNQCQFNVFHHNDDMAAACQEHNITVEAFAPFTDFHFPIPSEAHTVFHDPTALAVAQKYNVSAAQVSTRWLYQQGHPFVFLSSNPDHQANSADFMDFELTDDDMQTLSSIRDKLSSVELV
jgi:diketogulonate reductase-like aldo/keto reductase